MTDLTAQYRAKNGVAQFEIFAERDGVLYGRAYFSENSSSNARWECTCWINGGNEYSKYYDIEPIPVDHGLKVDDLVWVWNNGGHKKIRCFANWLTDGSIGCFHDGETSLSNTSVFSWDNWEKYEPEQSATEAVKTECDDDKAWMDVLSYSGVKPLSPSENAISSYFAGKAQHVKIDVVYSPETSKAEPQWHKYLKQGYMIVCEVWHDIEPVPPIIQMVNAIRGDGLYMGEIAWDFARPVLSECGKFCTGVKDGKTVLLPLE